MVNTLTIVLIISSFVNSIFTIPILRKKYESIASLWLLLLLFDLSISCILQALLTTNITNTIFITVNQIIFFGVVIFPPILLAFILTYTGKETITRNYWYICANLLSICTMLYLLWKTDFIFVNNLTKAHPSPWGHILAIGDKQIILQIYYAGYFLVTFVLLFYYYFKSKEHENKKKALIFFLATVIPFWSNGIFYVLFPVIFHLPSLPIANITFSITTTIFTLTILKYGVTFFNPVRLATTALETMNESVLVINKLHNIEYINKGGEKLLKYDSKSILKQNIEILFDTDANYQKTIKELLVPIENQQISTLEEVVLQTSKKEKITTDISTIEITNDTKQVTGYILIMNDISQIKKSIVFLEQKVIEFGEKNKSLENMHILLEEQKQNIEQKIEERTRDLYTEHARLQASVDNLGLGFIMTDNAKSIIMINQKTKYLFNLTSSVENINLQDLQIKIKDTTVNLADDIGTSIKEVRKIGNTEVKVDDKFLNIFISPININSYDTIETIGTVIIIEDVTETKVIQKSKEEFFNIASHELRAPLMAIKGYTSLIRQYYFDKITSNDVKKMVVNIDTSNAKLLSIVNNFLDTSQLEQGKLVIQREPLDLTEVIQSTIKEIGSIAIEKKVLIKFDPPQKKIAISADKQRLKQVLINLIGNGLKFTEQGEVSITIENEDLNNTKIYIHDTGKGISDQNTNLLFRKFQQAEENLYTRDEGTGLGLYISKLLIEKMGGEIKLEKTTINKGSTFSLTLPNA